MKTISYALWFYDVWGNAEDGYEVNDRYCDNRNLEIECADDDGPTMAQIAEILGCPESEIEETGGDDMVIYINEASDGKPLCEFIRNDRE